MGRETKKVTDTEMGKTVTDVKIYAFCVGSKKQDFTSQKSMYEKRYEVSTVMTQ